MKTCLICGKLTEGSVGVANLRWSRLCQPCKDAEDKALADRINYEFKATNAIFKVFER